MATNFPNSLDDSTTIPVESANTKLSTNHVTAHQNIQDAIEAIETKVGANSSAVTTSHDYKLSEVTSTDKAVGKTATQTLSGKTFTSPIINVGSDAEGDTYYRNSSGALTRLARGTDNYIYKMNGNVPNWEAEASISAATESAEGISRLATAAQITAGTASEGGYPLVVTPDQLAASTPVFNGSGLTDLPYKGVITTLSTASAGSGSSAVFSYTLPVLRTTSFVELLLPFAYDDTAAAATGTLTMTVKLGATTIGTATLTKNQATNSGATTTALLTTAFYNNGATNSQLNTGTMVNPGGGTYSGNGYPFHSTGYTEAGTTTVDTSSAVALSVDYSFSAGIGTVTWKKPMIKII